MYKLKYRTDVVYLKYASHINLILNKKLSNWDYIPDRNYVANCPIIKHKTVTSKLIHTMHYVEIQPSAFARAVKQSMKDMAKSIAFRMKIDRIEI